MLHNDGELKATIDLLTEKGMTYEKDGALWYKASEHGGEKDEVLVRANGNPTYFAADIAYHRNKFARGFDTCIDVWGADHHGHVARMKGAMDAVGLDGSRLHVVLLQLVRLMQNGEVVRMSKRSGKAIQLADLLDEVPRWTRHASSSTCVRRDRRWISTWAWRWNSPPPTRCIMCSTRTRVSVPFSRICRLTV